MAKILLPMPWRRLESGVCHHGNLLLVTGEVMDSAENEKDTYKNEKQPHSGQNGRCVQL